MRNGEVILVIDDEQPFLETIRKILKCAGYQVCGCADGADAVATFSRNQDRIKAVICDLIMAGLDGVATVRIIKKINSGMKVIFSSALIDHPEQKERVAELKTLGVNAFLTKPY